MVRSLIINPCSRCGLVMINSCSRCGLVIIGLIAMMSMTAAANSVSASTSLRAKLRPLAQKILDVLKEENMETVAFAEFPPDPFTGSNSGPGLREILMEELQALAKRKDIIQSKANVTVHGRYQPVESEDQIKRKFMVVKLYAEMVNRQGKTLLRDDAVIDNNEDIARIASYTGDLPLNANKEDLNRHIQDGLKEPTTRVQGPRIDSGKGQPFSLAILARSPGDRGFRVRKPLLQKGLAFVELGKNDLYQIVLYNDAPLEAAVTVNIDGLDVFTFTDERESRHSHFVVPSKGRSVVRGWFKTSDPGRDDNFLSFLVTDYGKGAASSRKAVGNTGVISVTFAAAWKGDSNRPEDEARRRSGGSFETGFGPAGRENFQSVSRTIGNIRDSISVRYSR